MRLLLFIHATSFAFCMIGYNVLVHCKGFVYLSYYYPRGFDLSKLLFEPNSLMWKMQSIQKW